MIFGTKEDRGTITISRTIHDHFQWNIRVDGKVILTSRTKFPSKSEARAEAGWFMSEIGYDVLEWEDNDARV